MIALNAAPFWIMCLATMAGTAPLIGSPSQRVLLAGLNFAFVTYFLGWSALWLAGMLLGVWLLLRLTGLPMLGIWLTLAASLGALALFVIHKTPADVSNASIQTLKTLLSVIGYSYVMLRFFELLRAVHEGRRDPPDLISLINYLIPFHMLAAGPIQSYDDFVRHSQSIEQSITTRQVLTGAERVSLGVFKKFVLALALQKVFLTNFESTGLWLFIEVNVFYVWLYLDFSAYSDIAVGVGHIIGAPAPENFNNPLVARNIIDFWDRWHISLSMFIRRNLFLPIQLVLMRWTESHLPLTCASIAVAISFLLCGLWHGLGPNFLAWGGVHAAGLVIARIYAFLLQRHLGSKRLKAYRANSWVRLTSTVITFEFVAFSFLTLFRLPTQW